MRALKKGSFRLVHRNVWEALAKFGKGKYREALAFLYLETGPHSNYTGLFQAPLVDIAKYTSMTNAETLEAIGNLSRAGWIVYDQDRQMVFVKGMMQRQLGTSTPNEDNTKGVIYHVERMPEESPAVEAFMAANREIPGIDDLYDAMYGGDTPGGDTGGLTTGATPTRDFELRTSDLELGTSNEKHITAIADALTPCVGSSSSSTPKSTPGKSTAKASGKGEPGNGKPDALATFISTLPSGRRESIEDFWKAIRSGKASRPAVRDELKRVGWFTEEQIRYLIPEKGSASDFLSVAN